MLCSICKSNQATVHLTQIVSDKMQKVDLCESCAKEKGVNDPAGFSMADMLLGLGASQEMEEATGSSGLQCPRCGFTQADFKKTGRLGCSSCYEVFAEGLQSLLKSMHKGTRHVGKVPPALRKSRDLQNKLQSLESQLKQAIDNENFEQAAVLRDQIKQLREEMPATSDA